MPSLQRIEIEHVTAITGNRLDCLSGIIMVYVNTFYNHSLYVVPMSRLYGIAMYSDVTKLTVL